MPNNGEKQNGLPFYSNTYNTAMFISFLRKTSPTHLIET